MWKILDHTVLKLEAICLYTPHIIFMEGGEMLKKFALRLKKCTQGLTLSNNHIKSILFYKAQGLQDFEIVLEDRAGDLDLIVLAEKVQNMLTPHLPEQQ